MPPLQHAAARASSLPVPYETEALTRRARLTQYNSLFRAKYGRTGKRLGTLVLFENVLPGCNESPERLDFTGFRWFVGADFIIGAAMARLLLAVLIGIGLTLGWQSYGEGAKQTVGPWVRDTITEKAPSLSWLLPSWTKPQPQPLPRADEAPQPIQVEAAPKQPRALPFRDVTDTELPTPASPAPPEPPSLDTIARDVAAIRLSTEQLAAKQQQLADGLETLRTAINEKLGGPSAAMRPDERATQAAPGPARRPGR
jgi:hypothetical protein